MKANLTYFTPMGRLDGRGEATYPADFTLEKIHEDVRKMAERDRLPNRVGRTGIPCVLVDVPELPENRPWLFLPFKDALDALDCFDVFYARTAEKIQHADPRNARGIMDMAYSVRRWVRGLVREFSAGSRVKSDDPTGVPGTLAKILYHGDFYLCDFLRERIHEDETMTPYLPRDEFRMHSEVDLPPKEVGQEESPLRRLRSLRFRVLFGREGVLTVPEPLSEESYAGTGLRAWGEERRFSGYNFESLGTRNFSPFFFRGSHITFKEQSVIVATLPFRRWKEHGFCLDMEPQKILYPEEGDRFIVRLVRHYAEFIPRASEHDSGRRRSRDLR